jgi:hypothetical protein
MEFGSRGPGEHVLLREVCQGKVWTLRPVIVVVDAPELVALDEPWDKRRPDPAWTPPVIPERCE